MEHYVLFCSQKSGEMQRKALCCLLPHPGNAAKTVGNCLKKLHSYFGYFPIPKMNTTRCRIVCKSDETMCFVTLADTQETQKFETP